MAKRRQSTKPSWTDVKAEIATFDRAGLLGLIQDLYVASAENQTFLHTRFGLGEDVLKPYKETLRRWLSPDPMRNQDASVTKAKGAISSYRKAVGDPAGLAELMVFYCECAAHFSHEFGCDDVSFLNALVRMFRDALEAVLHLSPGLRNPLIARLEYVCTISDFGYGVGHEMGTLLGMVEESEPDEAPEFG